LPSEKLTAYIAKKCKVEPKNIFILVAPTGSLVGLVNVIARTLETSMWRLHELGFDVNNVISAWGKAPLPPISKDDKSKHLYLLWRYCRFCSELQR